MDLILKRSRQFYKHYQKLKQANIDVAELKRQDIFTELKSAVDGLDVRKTFEFKDSLFPKGQGLGFTKLHQEEGVNISIFYVSKYSILPLHDHPGMYVFARGLTGKAKKVLFSMTNTKDIQTQFDYQRQFWNYYEKYGYPSKQLEQMTVSAQQTEMHLVEAGDPSLVIEPTTNNLHEIIAVENFAFLDVLVPDYDMDSRERFCNFYSPTKIQDANQQIYELKIAPYPENIDYSLVEVQSPLLNPIDTVNRI